MPSLGKKRPAETETIAGAEPSHVIANVAARRHTKRVPPILHFFVTGTKAYFGPAALRWFRTCSPPFSRPNSIRPPLSHHPTYEYIPITSIDYLFRTTDPPSSRHRTLIAILDPENQRKTLRSRKKKSRTYSLTPPVSERPRFRSRNLSTDPSNLFPQINEKVAYINGHGANETRQ